MSMKQCIYNIDVSSNNSSPSSVERVQCNEPALRYLDHFYWEVKIFFLILAPEKDLKDSSINNYMGSIWYVAKSFLPL